MPGRRQWRGRGKKTDTMARAKSERSHRREMENKGRSKGRPDERTARRIKR